MAHQDTTNEQYDEVWIQVIHILGLDDMPVEGQRLIIEDLGEILVQNAMLSIIEQVSDEDAQKIGEIFEKNTDPVDAFSKLEEAFPQFNEILIGEAKLLKEEFDRIITAEEEEG